MEDRFKRLSKTQVEIWLDDPVTKYHLMCLENQVSDVEDIVNSGQIQDPTNNDLTCHRLSFYEGQKTGYRASMAPEVLFDHYQMVEEADDAEDNE